MMKTKYAVVAGLVAFGVVALSGCGNKEVKETEPEIVVETAATPTETPVVETEPETIKETETESETEISKPTIEELTNDLDKCYSEFNHEIILTDDFFFINLYDSDLYDVFVGAMLGKNGYDDLADLTALTINENCDKALDVVKAAGYNLGVAVAIGLDSDNIVYCSFNGITFYDARYTN